MREFHEGFVYGLYAPSLPGNLLIAVCSSAAAPSAKAPKRWYFFDSEFAAIVCQVWQQVGGLAMLADNDERLCTG